MQASALGNEEEQLVSLLLSKGAAESALADEMGRLKVQEEVCILGATTHIPPTPTSPVHSSTTAWHVAWLFTTKASSLTSRLLLIATTKHDCR